MIAERESKFMSATFAVLLASVVLRISDRLMGSLREQPWWSIALTIGLAAAVAAYTWRTYRVYEREKIWPD